MDKIRVELGQFNQLNMSLLIREEFQNIPENITALNYLND